MPRLTHSLLRRARSIGPLLPPLLQACRDLDSARNELRWLREHVNERAPPPPADLTGNDVLEGLVRQRSRGKPLQYILGNQPFGELDILCRPGVLIPRRVKLCPGPVYSARPQKLTQQSRPETETYTTHLAELLLRERRQQQHEAASTTPGAAPPGAPTLKILDLCTGTGCIALLLHALLSPHVPALHIRGVDVSAAALGLSRANLSHNSALGRLPARAAAEVDFVAADVLGPSTTLWSALQLQKQQQPPPAAEPGRWDVVVSNPPYISPTGFWRDTAAPVRRFEPRLALVPPARTAHAPAHTADGADTAGDAFYGPIMAAAAAASARLVVMEVADRAQATRVLAHPLASSRRWTSRAVWRDNLYNHVWPDAGSADGHGSGQDKVHFVGNGNARAVVLQA